MAAEPFIAKELRDAETKRPIDRRIWSTLGQLEFCINNDMRGEAIEAVYMLETYIREGEVQ